MMTDRRMVTAVAHAMGVHDRNRIDRVLAEYRRRRMERVRNLVSFYANNLIVLAILFVAGVAGVEQLSGVWFDTAGITMGVVGAAVAAGDMPWR